MSVRILVVDDTETVRSYQVMLLSQSGYEVLQASDGFEAISMVLRAKVDIVMLDIEMPGMDGIEVCRRLKNDKSISTIKIVMVTTLSEYEKISEAYKAGADDYITKPINSSELLSKVRELSKFVEISNILKS